jgi:two-component system phosphate regulon sensor histidine kinase PhoR
MRTIRSKITSTYIAVSAIVIILFATVSTVEIERYYFDRLLSELKAQTGLLTSFLKQASATAEQRKSVAPILTTLSSSNQIRITLVDSDGRVLYESSLPDSLLNTMENHATRPEITQAWHEGLGHNVRFSTTTDSDMIYVARRAELEQDGSTPFPKLSIVRVGIAMNDFNETVAAIRLRVFLAALVVFIVGLLISRIVANRLSRPLVEIARIVEEIKAGHLERKLPVRSDDEVGRLAGLINEMTDKLTSDIEQLKKLERVRSQFLGNVSHELRTPIFSLKGFLETLLEGALDDQAVNKRFVERAYHQATRLDALLSDLIDISRIESGDMKMSFRYFELDAFLRQVKEDFSYEAEKKRQSISVVGGDHRIVYGDKDLLRQAIGNIIDNALKYSPEGSSITVSVEEKPLHVTVKISDNGPGIAAEHLPRIFERFYRVDQDRSREVGGTGLGLAIVKHIIEAHGSKVLVFSEVGKGTTFEFDVKK